MNGLVQHHIRRTVCGVGMLTSLFLTVIALSGCTESDAAGLERSNGASLERANVVNIERVLTADATTTAGARSVAEIVARMRAIDCSGCSTDFRSGYLAHIHAWEMAAAVEQEAAQFDADFGSWQAMLEAFLRGMCGDPFGKASEAKAAENLVRQHWQQAGNEIGQTFHKVEEIAVAHGANLPRPS